MYIYIIPQNIPPYGGICVPETGIEPALPKEHDFESCASTNSAIPAYPEITQTHPIVHIFYFFSTLLSKYFLW